MKIEKWLLQVVIGVALVGIVAVYGFNLGLDIAWMVRNNIPLLRFLKYALDFYGSVYLLFFIYVIVTIKLDKKLEKFFSWKLWSIPVSILIFFSFGMWRFNPTLNYDTTILGFEWQWSAIITWLTLFLVLHYLFQRRVSSVYSWLLSFCSIRLGAMLYEVPWYINSGRWIVELYQTKLVCTVPAFIFLLYLVKWKPSLWFVLTVIPLIVEWIVYYSLPNWLPRLATFPFFLSFPFGIDKIDKPVVNP